MCQSGNDPDNVRLPVGGYMDDSIRRTLTQLPEVDVTHMDRVWEPAWKPHMMTDDAKRQLGWVR